MREMLLRIQDSTSLNKTREGAGGVEGSPVKEAHRYVTCKHDLRLALQRIKVHPNSENLLHEPNMNHKSKVLSMLALTATCKTLSQF